MKILMVSILNFEEDINGVVISAKELQQALMNKGHVVDVLTPYNIKNIKLMHKILRWNNQMFCRTNISFFMLMNLYIKTFALGLSAKKLKSNYDYFHAHDVFAAAAINSVEKNRNNILMQIHFHKFPWEEFSDAGYAKSSSLSYKIIKKFASAVLQNKNLFLLPVSNYILKLTKQITPDIRERSTIFYPGLKELQDIETTKAQGNYIINVGTINKRKNQIFLIDLLKELEKNGVQIPLILVGREEIDNKAKIIDYIKKIGLQTPVYFTGQKSEQETRNLIRNSKMYIHSSNLESFGRTLVEAINLRVPVLALEYEAAYEILPQESILKKSLPVIETAKHVYKYLESDTDRNKLKRLQYKKYLKLFTEEKMLKTYQMFLNRIGDRNAKYLYN